MRRYDGRRAEVAGGDLKTALWRLHVSLQESRRELVRRRCFVGPGERRRVKHARAIRRARRSALRAEESA